MNGVETVGSATMPDAPLPESVSVGSATICIPVFVGASKYKLDVTLHRLFGGNFNRPPPIALMAV